MKIISVDEMRQIEKEAYESGISYEQMMITAGKKIAQKILSETLYLNRTITAIIGTGNNGGDALIALTELIKEGWTANAWMIRKRHDKDNLLSNFHYHSGQTVEYQNDQYFNQLDQWLQSSDILLDGALGIGCHLPLASDYSEVFSHIHSISKRFTTIAVDCPSGMDCDSGECDEHCIHADLTFCVEALKIGEIQNPGYRFTGKIESISLDLPENLPIYQKIKRNIIQRESLNKDIPVREVDGNKGTFGTVDIIGGSDQYIGAPILTGMAAYKAGCGLVNMFVPQIVRDISANMIPEAIWTILNIKDPHAMDLCMEKIIEAKMKKHAFVIGPGFGIGDIQIEFTRKFFEQVQEVSPYSEQNFIIDADGLNLLAALADWPKRLPQLCILTPHPGEFSRLSALPIQEIQRNRVRICEEYAKRWNKVVVLKGAYTVISSPDGRTGVLPIASSALAKAGSGDVLSGIIAGFLSQGISDQFTAACLGVWIHGNAGLIAKERIGNEYSVTATDIIQSIREAITTLIR